MTAIQQKVTPTTGDPTGSDDDDCDANYADGFYGCFAQRVGLLHLGQQPFNYRATNSD